MPLDKARKGMEDIAKFSRLPPNTRVEQVTFDGISAEWVYGENAQDDRVILYLHGGGYNICSPNTHRELVARIAGHCSAKALVPDYRLAPEHPFPCALEDALFAYRWLLRRGLTGHQIALAGDSAGGGLSLATALSLRDAGDPLPASIACISPWADLAMTGGSIEANSTVDPMLNASILRKWADNYIDTGDHRSPLVSPLYADLNGLPPLLIHVGTQEVLIDDSMRLVKKAEDDNVDVTLQVYDQLWHVFHLNARLMPEARGAVSEFALFIKERFDS
jgi:acetyl esterase/lipase